MSASVTLLKLRRPVAHVRELREDDCLPLGDLHDIRAALDAWMPGIEWDYEIDGRRSGPDHGLRPSPQWFRFWIDTAVQCVHVNGPSVSSAREAYRALCRATGWTAIDAQDLEMVTG